MNDDWYQFLFGRPSPGTSTTVPVLDYLRAPEQAPDAPRWAQRATETRARRGRGRAATPDERLAAMPIGPGGVTGDPPEPEPAPRVSFAVASGQDTEPFGDDFAAWYEATRGRPLPSSIMGYREDPADAPPRFAWGFNTETGEGAADNDPRPDIEAQRGKEPPDAETPPNPFPDTSRELMAAFEAERRAFDRQRRGQPSVADLIMLAVFGNRPRVDVVAEENEELRRRIRDGD